MKEAVKLHMVCILITIDTLFLRPSLHFTTLYLLFCLAMKLGLNWVSRNPFQTKSVKVI